jgi:hypothetical protein
MARKWSEVRRRFLHRPSRERGRSEGGPKSAVTCNGFEDEFFNAVAVGDKRHALTRRENEFEEQNTLQDLI